MRRISLVPAPISYSLASRSSRPVGIVVDVAVAAQRLDRLQRHPRCLLRRVEDRAGGVLARRLAAIARLRHRIHVRLRRVHRGVHVGELALHELELADRLAELLAFVHVRHHHVHAGLHDAERPRRQHRAFVVQPAHQHAHAVVRRGPARSLPAPRNLRTPVRRCWSRACPSLSSFCAVENPLKPFSIRKAVMPADRPADRSWRRPPARRHPGRW